MCAPSVHRSSGLVRALAHGLLLGAIAAPAGAGSGYSFVVTDLLILLANWSS